MDQAAGATDQLLLESKSHGTKNTRREREVTATNSKEKGHARPWQAALARTMKTTTGHGELFPAERTSRPLGPHGQALLGLDSHKSRSACCWTRAGQGAGCGAGLRDAESACSDAAARDAGRSCTATVNTVRERRPGDRAQRIERYEQQEARAKN